MKFRNFVVAAAGAFLLALTSYAQITAIEGDVKGEDGKPLLTAVPPALGDQRVAQGVLHRLCGE